MVKQRHKLYTAKIKMGEAKMDADEDVAVEDGLVLIQCCTCEAKFEFDKERDWIKQCRDCFKDKSTRRKCRICKESKILPTEPDYKNICGKCFTESAMRPCIGCKQLKIKVCEEWRQLCKDCWAMKDKYLKICKVCQKRPIKKGSPAWIETCTGCYLENLKKYFEPCPVCKSEKLTKRKHAPMCRDCMKSQGKVKMVIDAEDGQAMVDTIFY